MFPLSNKREDTFIGGLSMGGYGAMRNGIKYNNTFGYILSLSGAFVMEEIVASTNDTDNFIHSRDYAESCFGDLDKVLDSDKNPEYLIKKFKQLDMELPKVYMACGSEDPMIKNNKDFAKFLEENNIDVTFEVSSGKHNWEFWDEYIEKAIKWLPTEDSGFGINSGNVSI